MIVAKSSKQFVDILNANHKGQKQTKKRESQIELLNGKEKMKNGKRRKNEMNSST
jgi:hypothetical protein